MKRKTIKKNGVPYLAHGYVIVAEKTERKKRKRRRIKMLTTGITFYNSIQIKKILKNDNLIISLTQ